MPVRRAGLRPASMDIARKDRAGIGRSVMPADAVGLSPTAVTGDRGDSRRSFPNAMANPKIEERDATAAAAGVPFPVAALLLAMLLPRELEFHVGIALTGQRIVLLTFFPLAIIRLCRSRTQGPRVFDALIVSAFAYFWLALFPKETFDKALQSGSSQFLEAVGGYLIARAYLCSFEQFRATARLLLVLVVGLGIVAAIESVTHKHWMKHIAGAIGGSGSISDAGERLGLMRATTSFDHPIHYGTFCAAVFAMVWFLEAGFVRRVSRLVAIGAATFFSLSSAAYMGLLAVAAGAAWEVTTRNVKRRVWFTLAGLVVVYVVMAMTSNRSPLRIISTTFTLDASTAYYRLLIWDYGSANVTKNPWFGVPLQGYWERPEWMYSSTVDHYWLVTAMGGGLPAITLYLLGICWLVCAVYSAPGAILTNDQRQCRHAWTAVVLVLIMIGTTVHFWREMEVFFTFVLGMGGIFVARPPAIGAATRKKSPFDRSMKLKSREPAPAAFARSLAR